MSYWCGTVARQLRCRLEGQRSAAARGQDMIVPGFRVAGPPGRSAILPAPLWAVQGLQRQVMKQSGIASFFKNPKAVKDESSRSPGVAAPANTSAEATSQHISSPAAVLKDTKNSAVSEAPAATANKEKVVGRKRLRKAADDRAVQLATGVSGPAVLETFEDDVVAVATPDQAASPSGIAREATEDEELPNDSKPTKKQKAAAKTAVKKGKGSAKQKVKQKLEAEGADKEEIEAIEGEPEEEVEEQLTASAAKKPVLRAPGTKDKPGGVKVEGVGSGAVTAAAKHSAFSLEELATWQHGAPVPFAFLADTFEAIAETTKRLVITQLLTNCFRAILGTTPEDLLPAVYLCTNSVAPSHEGTELGVGDSILVKALAHATGRTDARVKKDYEESGDLGTVAASARATQRTMFPTAPLTIPGVFKVFREIAKTEGNKSQDKKINLISKLLVSSKGNEPGYIMRALQGKLRIGLAEQTVLVALGQAVLLWKQSGDTEGGETKVEDSALAGRLEEAARAVKMAYSQCPSYDVMLPALLEHGIQDLGQRVHFVAGVPVKPMLAKAMTGISAVLDKFQDTEFTCEYKYDGERAQVHFLEDGRVAIYSRNSENNTSKYPDIAASIPKLIKPGVKSVVLDCEAVAYDRETKKLQPFQVLSTRARKDVQVADIKVQVVLFAFDCLYLNGEVLLQKPLQERREALYSAITEKQGELAFAVTTTSRDVEELAAFLTTSVSAGTEGLIVKTLSSTYEPSRRSAHWVKLKKDYLEGAGDTFDVVPIGAWYGKGKRTGVFGAFLLAIYNEEAEEFQTISKIGTGFSEEQLKQLAETLKGHIIDGPRPYYRWGETLEPNVWFDAKEVWEVKCADISISPVHRAAAGLVDETKGISIRFPRLVRVRDDKKPEDATSAEQVAELYRNQAIHSAKDAAGDDDEY